MDLTPGAGSALAPARPAGLKPGERKRELVIFWAYRAGERLINSLPRWLALAVAAALGNVVHDAARGKQDLIRENLARPIAARPDDRRVRRAARRAFRNYAKYLVDMMRIGEISADQAADLVRIANIDSLHDARAKGKGVLICTVHVGGMDLIGPGLKRHGEAIHVVADDTTYGRLYDHLAAARAKQDIFLIGWRKVRTLFRVLRANQNLVLFCDGGYRRGDVPVEFLGEPTTFPAGPATLAAKSGAPMLPVFCRRTRDDRFEARGLPLIHATGTSPAELHAATQQLADALGSVIAEDPGQWYMFRPVWPRTDADRKQARGALEAARRGEDWNRR